ncbi:hypothetical protein BJX63DRAFT_57567 [Aspergillus granulosus]|uniref:Uncharacterized protein n=1 Tax=Aspergillus granulosus TaxID=176169 RepID=A0ABR4GXC0_9EURO
MATYLALWSKTPLFSETQAISMKRSTVFPSAIKEQLRQSARETHQFLASSDCKYCIPLLIFALLTTDQSGVEARESHVVFSKDYLADSPASLPNLASFQFPTRLVNTQINAFLLPRGISNALAEIRSSDLRNISLHYYSILYGNNTPCARGRMWKHERVREYASPNRDKSCCEPSQRALVKWVDNVSEMSPGDKSTEVGGPIH